MRQGLPAVVIVTEQFEGLAKVVLKSQQVPDSVAILVRGNPEMFSDDEIARISEQVLKDVVSGLTNPHGLTNASGLHRAAAEEKRT